MKRIAPALLLTGALLTPLALTQNPPAPTVDRIGFPADYETWQVLYVYDRPDNKQVRTIFANPAAFAVKDGEQWNYPYGSILVMQTWACLKDAATNCILDANGRFQKDPAATPTVFVMKKDKGFGVDYQQNRTGEWEYVAYRPDGTYQTTPQNSFSCAICHSDAQKANDWTFRTNLHIYGWNGSVPGIVMQSYQFLPNTLRVKAGSVVTIVNNDGPVHTVTDDANPGWDSGRIKVGDAVSVKFAVPGEFNFHCSIHPSMRGKIIVEQ